ncbi:Uncharacterised protein [Candidatus Venteria ishoeyi]|uniref:Uncharacterized protein n=2 Tax=Candidatus Venteria ishoeyi TaxID=1899563 RepID=A0A1H6F3R6_9GAMM|nr:Uncharacterised protein [Candidatus Venteria ishoeyi]
MMSERTVQEQMEHFCKCGQCFEYIANLQSIEHIELHSLLKSFSEFAKSKGLDCILPVENRDTDHSNQLFHTYIKRFGEQIRDEFNSFLRDADIALTNNYLEFKKKNYSERRGSHDGVSNLALQLVESYREYRRPIPAAPPRPRIPKLGEKNDDYPHELRSYIEELEEWSKENKKEATLDTFAFWSLKLPAIIVAATTGLWAHYELEHISIISGSVASICIAIDGIHPRGLLRNTHLRAHHDIRSLLTIIVNKWRMRNSKAKLENIMREIIRDSEPKREEIAKYIREAETALKHKTET